MGKSNRYFLKETRSSKNQKKSGSLLLRNLIFIWCDIFNMCEKNSRDKWLGLTFYAEDLKRLLQLLFRHLFIEVPNTYFIIAGV
jgi:hypothetical protein